MKVEVELKIQVEHCKPRTFITQMNDIEKVDGIGIAIRLVTEACIEKAFESQEKYPYSEELK